jgi:hypothetical protein
VLQRQHAAICTPLKAIHLRKEKILHRGRSRRSWPSKIHGATPPRNSAAVETLLRAARASREPQSGIARVAQPTYPERIGWLQRVAAFDYSKELNLHRNGMNRGLFTYARHSVEPRHS